ncbi:DUF6151 family protein [Photobacterium sanguinicancri]|uniref:DUF6151 family protein n=1 Tax=Photobacterium sanguinicancri TaxID=875932 RepID=UPI0026E2FECF|nr:DUF6151 family protein [Photobacterium sanguinicancri]MDO6496935.1 DUF6151 family protein [Photobacterium sanguinicancri]
MSTIELSCSCGKVKGEIQKFNISSCTRFSCCCDDCQSFSLHLKCHRKTLDQYGGTEILQVPISNIKITEGIGQIACIRLKPKGMYRWYSNCCMTPMGNSMGPEVPFFGVIHNFIENTLSHDDILGENRGYVQTKFAIRKVPVYQSRKPILIFIRIIYKIINWKLQGLNKPSVFFDANKRPIINPKVIG